MKTKNTMQCYECGNNMVYKDITIEYTVRGKRIIIKNVKGYMCAECGFRIIEDKDFAMIEQLLTSIPKNSDIELLNLSETADLLRVSNQTIYNKIRSGELKAFKVGREWRFLRPDIEAFMHGANATNELVLAARGGKISGNDINIIKEAISSQDEEQ